MVFLRHLEEILMWKQPCVPICPEIQPAPEWQWDLTRSSSAALRARARRPTFSPSVGSPFHPISSGSTRLLTKARSAHRVRAAASEPVWELATRAMADLKAVEAYARS